MMESHGNLKAWISDGAKAGRAPGRLPNTCKVSTATAVEKSREDWSEAANQELRMCLPARTAGNEVVPAGLDAVVGSLHGLPALKWLDDICTCLQNYLPKCAK